MPDECFLCTSLKKDVRAAQEGWTLLTVSLVGLTSIVTAMRTTLHFPSLGTLMRAQETHSTGWSSTTK
jgi:hypothetical protein